MIVTFGAHRKLHVKTVLQAHAGGRFSRYYLCKVSQEEAGAIPALSRNCNLLFSTGEARYSQAANCSRIGIAERENDLLHIEEEIR